MPTEQKDDNRLIAEAVEQAGPWETTTGPEVFEAAVRKLTAAGVALRVAVTICQAVLAAGWGEGRITGDREAVEAFRATFKAGA